MKGDCGICNLGAAPVPRADRSAGLANGDGGIVTRGDSGLLFAVLACELACEAVL